MKRLFDIIAALTGLILFSPLMILIAVLVRVTSRGPALFSQLRVGYRKQLFRVYKYRSMVRDAQHLGTSVTTAIDCRTTVVGRILRRTKLDELPQLWNVLVGDMSLVGPRPDVPEIVARYNPEMQHIFDVRPGITSIATLHLRDEESLLALSSVPDEVYEQVLVPYKVALAMQHAERDSFFFDMGILLRTVWVLTLGRLHPGKTGYLSDLVQREIINYQSVAHDERHGHAEHNWERYRRLIAHRPGRHRRSSAEQHAGSLSHQPSMDQT